MQEYLKYLNDKERLYLIGKEDPKVFLDYLKKPHSLFKGSGMFFGKKASKSLMVQRYLPSTILKLLRTREPFCNEVMELRGKKEAKAFTLFLEKSLGRTLTREEAAALSIEEIGSCFKDFCENEEENPLLAFETGLSLICSNDLEEKKNTISKLYESMQETTNEKEIEKETEKETEEQIENNDPVNEESWEPEKTNETEKTENREPEENEINKNEPEKTELKTEEKTINETEEESPNETERETGNEIQSENPNEIPNEIQNETITEQANEPEKQEETEEKNEDETKNEEPVENEEQIADEAETGEERTVDEPEQDKTEESGTKPEKAGKKIKLKKLSAREKAKAKEAARKEAFRARDLAKAENETESLIQEKEIEEKKEVVKTVTHQEKEVRYLGVITIKNEYYNFIPIASLIGETLVMLSMKELDELLPLSKKRNINFYYSYWDPRQVQFMKNRFFENQIVVLDAKVEELEENRLPDGTINPTGYKMPVLDAVLKKKVCHPSDFGLFTLLNRDELSGDIRSQSMVVIKDKPLVAGEKILVNMKDGFYAGPYEVFYNNVNEQYYIRPQAVEGKHFSKGYAASDFSKVSLTPASEMDSWFGSVSWIFYRLRGQQEPEVRDFLSDEELLQSFKNSLLHKGYFEYERLDVKDIIASAKNTQITGEDIPDNIRQNRIDRLKLLLSAQEHFGSICSDVTEMICDLIIRENHPKLLSIMAKTMKDSPELMTTFSGVNTIQTRIEQGQRELKRIEGQIEDMMIKKRDLAKKQEELPVTEKEQGLSEEIRKKEEQLSSVSALLETALEAKSIKDKKNRLKEEVGELESHRENLLNDTEKLEQRFEKLLSDCRTHMADISFDGYMSEKMMAQASAYENLDEDRKSKILAEKMNLLRPEEGTDPLYYLVTSIQKTRPGYSRNLIVHILTCVTQGFLTVFFGAPGSGKTSICNILATVLGLNKWESIDESYKGVSRFLSVSVERGWTSKRDFIGYYNPLTKTFEESSREVYDGLRLLDAEVRCGYANWPYLILLDEANLSPMEYYWADFMSICDDRKDNDHINLGSDRLLYVPETLHFLATINHDHTTELLSPRLIDRAFIITLPKTMSYLYTEELLPEEIRQIGWQELSRLFSCSETERRSFDAEISTIYDGIRNRFYQMNLFISPRVEIAISHYWSKASLLMEDEGGRDASLVALDYAISAKLLPKIMGQGEEFAGWLGNLLGYMEDNGLIVSAGVVKNILEKGNRQMKYYQFFC